MTQTTNRSIDYGTYLQALALFTMSVRRYQELRSFERELTKLLGLDDFGHVSDAIYNEDGGDAEKRLTEALVLEGISRDVPTPSPDNQGS